MMRRHALLLLLLAPGVGGCATPATVVATRPSPSTENPNPVQVSKVTVTHTVHFAPGAGAPDPRELAAVDDFLVQSDAAAANAALLVTAGPGGGGIAQGLADALARRGLKPQVMWAADAPAGTVRLVVERYEASVPNCPNWSKPPGNDVANTLHSDFGCATAANLAAMVADPRDLALGRSLGAAQGDPAVAAVERYRAGKTTLSGDQGAGALKAFTVSPGGAPSQ
jgi:pilus assembly protein CpaD